jgi:hypothetical protein
MAGERNAEQLRQERETFEQEKDQGARWFELRLRMGYLGIIVLVGIAALAAFILLSPDRYSAQIQEYAAVALLVDMVGLIVSVFKLVLQPGNAMRLEPVTGAVQARGKKFPRETEK